MRPAICELMDQFDEPVIVVDESERILFGNRTAQLRVGQTGRAMPENYKEFLVTLPEPEKFRVLHAPVAAGFVLLIGSAEGLRYVSPSFGRVFGRESTLLHKGHSSLLDFVHHEDRPVTEKHFAKVQEGAAVDHEFRIVKPSGEIRKLWNQMRPIVDEQSGELLIVSLSEDITERSEPHPILQVLSDPVRACDSASHFRRAIEDRIRIWGTTPNPPFFAVAFLDLARFRSINESFGYTAGDGLLREVARRARGALGTGDTLARFGADLYAVLLGSPQDIADAETRMRNLLLQISGNYSVGSTTVNVVPRAGLAFPNGMDCSTDSLLRDADAAHQQAKQKRESLVTSKQPGSLKSLVQSSLEFDLARAISQDEFFFEFQPVFDPGNGRVRILEALLRWHHPRLGIISPASFISLAEDSGLVLKLDMLGLERLGRQMSAWRVECPRMAEVPVSINISGRHFPNFVLEKQFHRLLRQSPLRESRIIFEITESVFVEGSHRTCAGLQGLRDAGVQIWLDDFGEGYSSFRYLTHFPIDGLKVASCFVRSCADQPRSRVVLSSLFSLARGMGMQAIAEGVETVEQFETLRAMGFEALQGYYLSRPMPAKNIPGLFADSSPRSFELARSA
ncbi:putative bifunctional diguanylate cyclase/phosphodiesterase [Bryobacter aggregatus]|uniref:putative bifunctional diguanylate cyclase/phosphodiesterase n=1 Tax=Bryobacter aggregatus TaxID=360054 RepID=UPI0004E24DE6|nr:GGDEF and EAL domain-containing protein [Bryobacter aggregatus]